MARSPKEAFDDVDLAILALLQQDGRASFSHMARQLELPESTVRARTQRILGSGRVSIVATGNPLELGIPIDAISLLRVDPSAADGVAAELTAMPEVRYVGVALGANTVVVESLHPDAETLHDFLARQLPTLAGVKGVDSHQIIEIRKSTWDWQSWRERGIPRRLHSSEEET